MQLRERKKQALDNLFEVQKDLKQQKEDQNDVYFYLHKKLDDNYDVISSLEGQLLSEELERKAGEEKYAIDMEEDKKTFAGEEQKPKESLREVEEKLYGLKDVDGYKQETEQEMSSLLTDIEQERKEHYHIISEMERKAVKLKEIEKQKLLAEMKTAKLVLTDEAEKTLVKIKRDAKKDHERTGELLHNQGLKATKVLKKNTQVMNMNRKHRHDLALLGEIRQTMKEREVQYQKQIASLAEDLKDLDKEVLETVQEGNDKIEEMTIEEQSILAAIHELEASLQQAEEGVEEARGRAEDATNEYEIEVVCQEELDGFLSECLKDTRKQAAVVNKAGGTLPGWKDDRVWASSVLIPPRLQELSLAQRRAVFKYLIGEVQKYKLSVDKLMSAKGKGEPIFNEKAQEVGLSSMKTGIQGWDDYDEGSYLGTVMRGVRIGDFAVESRGCQTEEAGVGGVVLEGRGGRRILGL
ncbi:hypothetical protein TL16_g12591 [Triparma laevis f. inornata]|uniref:Cilia- and flagella-associated protein 157 n=1 Tax=Triparma laevis f. inornata TaxID=1714386 RepID=A0A9W7BMX2_9STRA|nr:hypothetical protein TL16_g12591 [Triparma laevis f. inornata]